MKKLNSFLLASLFCSSLFFTSCNDNKKEDEPEPEKTTTNQTDQEGASAIDDAMEDVNDIISNKIGGGSEKSNARVTAYALPCGIIKLDSSTVNGVKKYTVQYGQSNSCISFKRKSGTIAFNLTNGNTFAEAGAKYSAEFKDYKVEVIATGKEVTVNGTLTVTNVNGHYAWEALFGETIKHKVRGQLLITYENGEVRERNHYQLRTWSSDNGWAGLTFSVAGDTLDNISETGHTIDGNYYYQTSIIDPLTWSNCGSDFKGPYVLKVGRAKMDIDYPNVEDAYIEIEAGYVVNTSNLTGVPEKKNDCDANAYKIYAKFAFIESTQYQLY